MKKVLFVISIIVLITSIALCVSAHPGRTDGSGGHTDHSTGEYHYHHGYPAHDHYDMDGDGDLDCPYDFDDKTDHSSSVGDVAESGNSSQYDKDAEDPVNTDQESAPITFLDVLEAMLLGLLPAIGIFFFSAYLLSYIFFIFLDESQGCAVAIISGLVISLVAYVWMIIAKLS